MKDITDMTELDYFVGGLPPAFMFRDGYEKIINLFKKDKIDEIIYELSLIGLIAYFESFCRNYITACVNICPKLKDRFLNRYKQNPRANKNIIHIIENSSNSNHNLGFELFDQEGFFKSSNLSYIYYDFLNFYPFSFDDNKLFKEILVKRNMLIHNFGIYQKRHENFIEKKKLVDSTEENTLFGISNEEISDVYILRDSVILGKDDIGEVAILVEKGVKTIIENGYKLMKAYIHHQNINLPKSAIEALELLRLYEV